MRHVRAMINASHRAFTRYDYIISWMLQADSVGGEAYFPRETLGATNRRDIWNARYLRCRCRVSANR